MYEELHSVKDKFSATRGQLLIARVQIRQFGSRTTPPFSTPSNPHLLATLHPLTPHPLSSPSNLLHPLDTLHPPPDCLANLRASTHCSLNPVPYSTTIKILELNYSLYRKYLHRRVSELDSTLDIVYNYHHLLDVTTDLPPNPHDHL